MAIRQTGLMLGLVATLALPTVSGCGASSIAKQAFYELRGAQTEVMMVSPFRENALTQYRGLQVEPTTSTVGHKICPPKLLRYYDEFLADLPDDLSEVYPGGAPTLRISSEVLYFHPKGLLSGAMFLVRVRMHDADSESLVVDAVVLTESKSFREGGRSDLAESNVKGLRKFLSAQQAPEESLFDDL